MRHPSDGTLRRLLDDPAGVADADREHIVHCPTCRSGLAAAQEDAAVISAALDVEPAPDLDGAYVDGAWHRLSQAVAEDADRRTAVVAPARRWRTALRSPVVAVVAAGALLTGATAVAASNWLPIFRTEQIAPVTAPQADLVMLPDLSDFGELEVTRKVDVQQVADAAAAQEVSGLAIPRVNELPRGVTGEPTYFAFGQASAVFTFSAEKAAQFAAAAGQTSPPPPPGLDGSQFRLVVGPGLAAVWFEGRTTPVLAVARVLAPTAYSEGVPFATARDYVLSLPGLSATVAAQLRNFSADGTTLPMFMATERMTSSTADVAGVSATVFASRDGVMAGVVWVDGGIVTTVVGPLSADEVLTVARGLRWGGQ